MTIQDEFLDLCGRLGARRELEIRFPVGSTTDERKGILGRAEIEDLGKGFKFIEQAYSQPHRFYHDLTHISDCLGELREYRLNHGDDIKNPDAVELALFFHDVVYDPRAKKGKNEKQSALYVRKFCEIYGINKTRSNTRFNFGDRVHNLVLFTGSYSRSRDSDENLVKDCDLAILGQPKEVYDAYVENLSRESAPIPYWKFREERTKILKILSSGNIFSIPYFQRKYETKAQRNVAREISRLEKEIELDKLKSAPSKEEGLGKGTN